LQEDSDRTTTMSYRIEPAQAQDLPTILALVNQYADRNIMLPRTEESVISTLPDWLVACEGGNVENGDGPRIVVGCGSLVPLTEELVEVRSLAIAEGQQGKGLGQSIVLALVELAQQRGFHEVCALTLSEGFFTRLGFELVDRWSISPKVWQACIYCPKFHRCDEVAVLMQLHQPDEKPRPVSKASGWTPLMRYGEWRPLRLAYQQKSDDASLER
jgi:amino-acid N-acetyltransferase